MADPPPSRGLCDSCRHQRVVRNTRGSSFSLCELSRTDPRFPRYPRLPVRDCAGYQAREATAGGFEAGSPQPETDPA